MKAKLIDIKAIYSERVNQGCNKLFRPIQAKCVIANLHQSKAFSSWIVAKRIAYLNKGYIWRFTSRLLCCCHFTDLKKSISLGIILKSQTYQFSTMYLFNSIYAYGQDFYYKYGQKLAFMEHVCMSSCPLIFWMIPYRRYKKV